MNWIKANYQFLVIIVAIFFLFVYTMEKFTEMDRELGHIQVLTMQQQLPKFYMYIAKIG
ncbi:MAG: hypothetical protein LW832_01690 [Parachlamydia sp.]|jgi:hypothetical protein|nr:hypothetical protein [Parachlamydia sp.]